jgi:hypothetical protein
MTKSTKRSAKRIAKPEIDPKSGSGVNGPWAFWGLLAGTLVLSITLGFIFS